MTRHTGEGLKSRRRTKRKEGKEEGVGREYV